MLIVLIILLLTYLFLLICVIDNEINFNNTLYI
jgi:hypothetical protein